MKIKNVALIIGHKLTGLDKGSKNYLGQYESEYNTSVATYLKYLLSEKDNKFFNCRVFYKDGFESIKKFSQEIIKFEPDISIELHFNSFYRVAYGCEALALDGDYKSIEFADKITDYLEEYMGVKQRQNQTGVLLLNYGDRGFRNLNEIKKLSKTSFPIVILEPCFANIKTEESKKFFENDGHIKYAETIRDCLISYFNIDLLESDKDIEIKENSLMFKLLEIIKGFFHVK